MRGYNPISLSLTCSNEVCQPPALTLVKTVRRNKIEAMIPLPSFSEIAGIAKNAITLEDREKIMALREAALQLQEENLALKSEKKELEAKLKVAAELTFKDQFYWKEGDSTPFCPRCWEKNQQVIHVSPETTKAYDKIRTCPECSRDFKTGHVTYTPMISTGRARSHRERSLDGLV